MIRILQYRDCTILSLHFCFLILHSSIFLLSAWPVGSGGGQIVEKDRPLASLLGYHAFAYENNRNLPHAATNRLPYGWLSRNVPWCGRGAAPK